MKKLGRKLLIFAIASIFLYIISVVLSAVWLSDNLSSADFWLTAETYTNSTTLMIFGLAEAILVVIILYRLAEGKGKGSSNVGSGKDKRGNTVEQYFSDDFVSLKDLKTKSIFNFCTFKNLKNVKKDGVLVRAEKKNQDMEINFIKPIHTLIVGTTSSGKSTKFIEPTLQIMSRTASKPSFVITDPKGELYDHHCVMLKNQGYNIKVLDLRNPFGSIKWNPLAYTYDNYHRSFQLENEVKIHEAGDDPKSFKLVVETEFDYKMDNWFEFNGVAYNNRNSLTRDLEVIKQQLQTQAIADIRDCVLALAPVENQNDQSWEKTAQNLLQAIMIAMLEDSFDPRLSMNKDKYNLYNVYKIVNTQDSGRDPYATLKEYLFDYRDEFSQVNALANTALKNADTTTKNYMGFASAKMQLFQDTGISLMTSKDEIGFKDIDERPTALFLKIPDERQERYPLASLFVTQLYKRLVEKANTHKDLKLKRNVYFLLDEFANLPRFPDFGKTMAVGRSRGIFYELVIQSYSQLYKVYGDQEGKVIRDNCPIQVYVGSEDAQTNEEFSKQLGNKTIEMESITTSSGPDGKDNKSKSKNVQQRPIVYPHELNEFTQNQGYLIIKSFSPNACYKNKFTPYYEATDLYEIIPASESYMPLSKFDEKAIFYNIAERNKILHDANKGNSKKDFDDDFFNFD